MDFNSLGNGSPFYILTKHPGQKPTLAVGTVKEKVALQPQYQLGSLPSAYAGMNPQQSVRLIVTVNGNDRTIPDMPSTGEIAQKGDEIFTGSQQAIIQAIDGMMQASQAELERHDYNLMTIQAGREMMGVVNPQYAAAQQQEKNIQDLQHRQDEQGKMLKEMYAMLQKITPKA